MGLLEAFPTVILTKGDGDEVGDVAFCEGERDGDEMETFWHTQ